MSGIAGTSNRESHFRRRRRRAARVGRTLAREAVTVVFVFIDVRLRERGIL